MVDLYISSNGQQEYNEANSQYLQQQINDEEQLKHSKNGSQHHDIQNMNYLLVTAYFDIGATSWQNYTKDSSIYLNYLKHLCRANLKLIIFIDDRYAEEVNDEIDQLNDLQAMRYIVVFPINTEFLESNIISWQLYRQHMHAIMSTRSYQEKAWLRPEKYTPETLYPEYNSINFAKIDFVKYAIGHILKIAPYFSDVSHFGWIDSGYIRDASEIPRHFQPISALFNENVNVFYHNNYSQRYMATTEDISEDNVAAANAADDVSTARINQTEHVSSQFNFTQVFLDAPTDIPGAFWFGEKTALLRFHGLFHKCVHAMLEEDIADDDQAVLMCCYVSDPTLFTLWRTFGYLGLGHHYKGSFLTFYALNKLDDAHPFVGEFRLINIWLNARKEKGSLEP